MTLQHFQNQSCTFPLSGDDAITFSMLLYILGRPCDHIFTDRRDVVICQFAANHPVYIWCRNAFDSDAVTAIARCLLVHFSPERGFCYRMSYALLDRLKRDSPEFKTVQIETDMLSYALRTLNPVEKPCPGRMALATPDQIDPLAPLLQSAEMEMAGQNLPLNTCRTILAQLIWERNQFLWLNESNEPVSTAVCYTSAPYAIINRVYTPPAHRRQGFALHLVHAISAQLLAKKLTPVLHTDAHDTASNACYQKIGYRRVGSLCVVSARPQVKCPEKNART